MLSMPLIEQDAVAAGTGVGVFVGVAVPVGVGVLVGVAPHVAVQTHEPEALGMSAHPPEQVLETQVLPTAAQAALPVTAYPWHTGPGAGVDVTHFPLLHVPPPLQAVPSGINEQ